MIVKISAIDVETDMVIPCRNAESGLIHNQRIIQQHFGNAYFKMPDRFDDVFFFMISNPSELGSKMSLLGNTSGVSPPFNSLQGNSFWTYRT
jgi:hypothetical protein